MKLDELQKLAQMVPHQQGPQLQEWLHEQLISMGLNPNNLYQELEMTSRYVDTHRDTSHANAQLQLHSHTFFELLYCASNCGVEYLVGSERYRLQQGDIVFMPPGVSHRPLLPENMASPYIRYVLWISMDFMKWYTDLTPEADTPNKVPAAFLLRTSGTPFEYLGEMFLSGVKEAEAKTDGWQAAVIGNTIQLLTQLRRAAKGRAAHALKAEQPELLDRITTYVEGHYAQPIVIADLAKQFFVSSSTISHVFKQKLGVSFYRYVTQRRLIAAKTLIEKGQRLEAVANQTGFSDYSSFFRSFKQEYGISPRQYRKLQE
ncbi:MAG: helix-turn-helix domain-containing protein [Clostridia bacterium]|nr:helix-turn-helix domain-containing protein [Clostridia bacterium]